MTEYVIPEILSREHSLEDLMKMNPPDDAVLRRGSLLESVHCSDNSYTRRMSEVERIQEIMIKYEQKRKKWKKLRSIFCLN